MIALGLCGFVGEKLGLCCEILGENVCKSADSYGGWRVMTLGRQERVLRPASRPADITARTSVSCHCCHWSFRCFVGFSAAIDSTRIAICIEKHFHEWDGITKSNCEGMWTQQRLMAEYAKRGAFCDLAQRIQLNCRAGEMWRRTANMKRNQQLSRFVCDSAGPFSSATPQDIYVNLHFAALIVTWFDSSWWKIENLKLSRAAKRSEKYHNRACCCSVLTITKQARTTSMITTFTVAACEKLKLYCAY